MCKTKIVNTIKHSSWVSWCDKRESNIKTQTQQPRKNKEKWVNMQPF